MSLVLPALDLNRAAHDILRRLPVIRRVDKCSCLHQGDPSRAYESASNRLNYQGFAACGQSATHQRIQMAMGLPLDRSGAI